MTGYIARLTDRSLGRGAELWPQTSSNSGAALLLAESVEYREAQPLHSVTQAPTPTHSTQSALDATVPPYEAPPVNRRNVAADPVANPTPATLEMPGQLGSPAPPDQPQLKAAAGNAPALHRYQPAPASSDLEMTATETRENSPVAQPEVRPRFQTPSFPYRAATSQTEADTATFNENRIAPQSTAVKSLNPADVNQQNERSLASEPFDLPRLRATADTTRAPQSLDVHSSPPAPPDIEIYIGRIDIQTPPPPQPRVSSSVPRESLNDYLKSWANRGRL